MFAHDRNSLSACIGSKSLGMATLASSVRGLMVAKTTNGHLINIRRALVKARILSYQSHMGIIVFHGQEWPRFNEHSRCNNVLEEEIDLVLIAREIVRETKVALFHINTCIGKKPKELMGSKLRTIIQSPYIKKLGINIRTTDCIRLQH